MNMDRIALDPTVCHGKPTIRGTRVTVSDLLAAVAAGDPIDQVAKDYAVGLEDVLSAIEYARQTLDHESHFRLRAKAS